MSISIGWLELVIIAGAWVAVAYFRARAEGQGGGSVDTIPGSGLTQAPEVEYADEARLGFRPPR